MLKMFNVFPSTCIQSGNIVWSYVILFSASCWSHTVLTQPVYFGRG